MIDKKFLVDNNALGYIGARRRTSAFFRQHCRLTEDVAYEARYMAGGSAFSGLIEPVTPLVLHKLTEVMATVPIKNTDLLDLYANKGAADPVLVATALVLNERESESLLGDEWIVATQDRAVTAKAKEFGVSTISPVRLAQLIDGADPHA